MAFSVVRKLPNLDLIPSVRHICRDVKFAAYAVPGSQELSLEIGKVFEQGCNIALLENHGVCVGAPDMFTAFQQFETLNYTAELEVLAGQLGKIRALPENAYRLSETDSHQAGGIHFSIPQLCGAGSQTRYDYADPALLQNGPVYGNSWHLFRPSS